KARPTPLWEHGLKWTKRRPVAAMFLALGLVAFLGLTAGVIGYQRYNLVQQGRRNAWLLQQQDRGTGLLELVEKARTTLDYQNAQVEMAKLLQDAQAEVRLQSISRSIEAKQKWVGDQLQALSSREAAQQHDREDRERNAK